MTADPFNLRRFVDAQRDDFARARAELAAGRKRSHWIWYIFPQVAGLGSSSYSVHYGLSGLAEAAAYHAHPQLGPNLRDCTALVLARCHGAGDLLPLFASEIDVAKFHACMTLFTRAVPGEAIFGEALSRLFAGAGHAPTLRLLGPD